MTSRPQAVFLLALLLVSLFFGTQMPGAWRDEVFRVTQLPWQLTKVAHFVLFAGIAFLAHVQPLRWPWLRVSGMALGLALLTEFLQRYASHRDPSWLDVGIDMCGAGLGLYLARVRA